MSPTKSITCSFHSDNSRCSGFVSMCRDEKSIGTEDSLVDSDFDVFRVTSRPYYTAMEDFEDFNSVVSDSDDSGSNCSRFHSTTDISQISPTYAREIEVFIVTPSFPGPSPCYHASQLIQSSPRAIGHDHNGCSTTANCLGENNVDNFEESNNIQDFLDNQGIATEGSLASDSDDSSNLSNDSQSLHALGNSQTSPVCTNGENVDAKSSIPAPSPLCGTSQPIQYPPQSLGHDSGSCSSLVSCIEESSTDTTLRIRNGILQNDTAIFRSCAFTPLQSSVSQSIHSLGSSTGSARIAILFANQCLVRSYERRWLCEARRQARANYTVKYTNLLRMASSISSISSRSVTSAASHESSSCATIQSRKTSETQKWGEELLDDVSESSSLEKLRVMKIKYYREKCTRILKESVTHHTKLEAIRRKDKYRTSKWIRDTAKWRAQRPKTADKSCKEPILNDNSDEKENNNKEEQRPRKYRTSKWIQDTIKWRAQRQRQLENKSLNK